MRLRRFFTTIPGLLILATGWDALIVAFLSLFSEPMQSLLGYSIALDPAYRVGRIIMVYHSLAIPFVAAVVYLILDTFEVAEGVRRTVIPAITSGFILTGVGGIGFAYFGRNWLLHGVFLVGLSLVFYAGAALWVGLWPYRRYSSIRGLPLERFALWLTVLLTLGSAAIGAGVGAFFGNGFEAVLAEDIIRREHNLFERALIAHLHIMLVLIDVALLLVIIRRFDIRGLAHKVAIPFTIVGTLITTFATWSVMFWENAHKLINVGVFFLVTAGVIVASYGFVGLVRKQRKQNTALGRLKALLHDPMRFGIFYELVFVNLVVTIPGIYVALNLERYRLPEYLEIERTFAVGHWHVLATVSAVIGLFLVVDVVGLSGWVRKLTGWAILFGSSLAFIFVQPYMLRSPDQSADWARPFFETGIGIFLVALAVLMVALLRYQIATQDGILR